MLLNMEGKHQKLSPQPIKTHTQSAVQYGSSLLGGWATKGNSVDVKYRIVYLEFHLEASSAYTQSPKERVTDSDVQGRL